MALFDRYVVIDWSAAATPTGGADSIWIADAVGTGTAPTLTNPRTRRAASDWLVDEIAGLGSQRLLVGIDASLGYPRGSAAYFGLAGPPWRAMWGAISAISTDDDRNRNNRFDVAARLNEQGRQPPGPFWGCPAGRSEAVLQATKPPTFPVPEYRIAEERLRTAGSNPKSVWQLLGAGTVGGQTLTLLPVLRNLLAVAAVWPLTTGLRVPGTEARVVIAEVWPSWFVREIPTGMVKDAAQVAGTAIALAAADDSGTLAGWLTPTVDDHQPVEREEGWILGVA